ncbi:low-density lipoprotein receptor-related protein 11 [Periophthalmus magnuspinnatus]|uniref:low-density lipoprotein receptor-related protein 11 n=1 Tax=Periophthalmus magnuspinnatus TaxID=409849 RepID=UPI00145A77E4|nr:low-density lipoprotein receptor-related protein 11 [Periophthalmus magnuspinnatus]
MALLQHHQLLPLACALLLSGINRVDARSSQISDLKSKISGVEELLDEFRKQLQQEQAYNRASDVTDSCVGDYDTAEARIIRTRLSIEQGATFLLAPDTVYTWRDCLHACCSLPHCTVAVVQENPRQAGESLGCFLFNCTYRGRNVCSFAQKEGFSSFTRANANATRGQLPALTGAVSKRPGEDDEDAQEDEPPRSDAGQDVVIQLPTDWAVLDGRDSVDDHGISRYEWTLVRGDTAINMKVNHPGLLKVSGLREGVYTFEMTVTDTAGQKSSDNVSVSVLAPKHQAEVCTGHCSNYQFKCDDGCCIDITYACDGKQHCPDRSDEDFCPNFEGSRKSVSHSMDMPSPRRLVTHTGTEEQPGYRKTVESIVPLQENTQQDAATNQDPCSSSPVVGPCKGTFPRWYYDQEAGQCKHFLYGGCQGNHNNFLQESDCVTECIQKSPSFKPATVAPSVTKQTEIAAPKLSESQTESEKAISKPSLIRGGHPAPESAAILPLVLGVLITALLLLMIGCRLKLVQHKLKKARPLTTEESDYLINGMYL